MATMNREMPAKQNTENITSLEALWISAISTTLRDGKWPTTHNAARSLIRSDSRLSRQLALFTTAHFCPSGTRTLLISSRGARDLRMSGLHDVLPSPAGLKHNGLKRSTALVSLTSEGDRYAGKA